MVHAIAFEDVVDRLFDGDSRLGGNGAGEEEDKEGKEEWVEDVFFHRELGCRD